MPRVIELYELLTGKRLDDKASAGFLDEVAHCHPDHVEQAIRDVSAQPGATIGKILQRLKNKPKASHRGKIFKTLYQEYAGALPVAFEVKGSVWLLEDTYDGTINVWVYSGYWFTGNLRWIRHRALIGDLGPGTMGVLENLSKYTQLTVGATRGRCLTDSDYYRFFTPEGGEFLVEDGSPVSKESQRLYSGTIRKTLL